VNTTTPVVMSAKIVGANVLSVEWEFEGGAKETTTTQSGSVLEVEQTQIAEVTHKFTVAGKVTVKATIHTDDLATPTIPVSTTLTVEPPSGAPVVKPQPVSQVVVEGENATFKTGATGEPTPTVQWEQSVDHGTTWADVAAGTTGGTTDTLTVTSTTISENENEYRATFTNVVGTTTSAVATLTVETKKAHEEKLAEEKRKEEEAAAKKRVEEEAAAAKKRAEEEAAASKKRAEEEAAAAANKRAQEEAAAKKKAEEEAASHQVLNFKEGSPTATVAGTSLTVSASGAVTVKVSCAAGVKTCTGTVTLRTLGAVSARVASGAAEAKASVLTLASGSFSLTGGQAKAITLHLSAKARKLLAHSHSLRAKATIVAHNAEGASHTTLATVTLRAAKKK
jgi:hypothetical protein